MQLALPQHMNADRMTRLALTAFSQNETLQKCTPHSIASCVMMSAQTGLEIGVGGQAYLVPYFDRKKNAYICTFIPGWKGLVDLVARAGRATVWTGVVFPGDEFEYQLGDAPFCRHKPGDGGDGQKFTHVYAIGRVRDAQMPVIEVWSIAKVMKHLQRYNKQGERHYALSNDNNMEMYGRKVALLQVLKYMPSSIELQSAETAEHAAEEGRGLVIDGDFVTVANPDPEESTDPITGEITTPDAQIKTKQPEASPTFAQLHDFIVKRAKTIEEASGALADAVALPQDQQRDLAAAFNEKWTPPAGK
jgi:recombination protein RecT